MNFRIRGLRYSGAARLVCAVFSMVLVFSAGLSGQDAAPKGVGNKPADRKVSKLPPKEKRWALIVGVNNFGLQGAVNDARALRNTLIEYAGFPKDNVILLTTDAANPDNIPTKNNIIYALERLSEFVEPDGLFLFAFSGHGKTIENNAYIVPADGRMTVLPDLMGQLSIDSSAIKRAVTKMKVRQVLMILDSCRDEVKVDGARGNVAEPLSPTYGRAFSFDTANKDIDAFVTLYGTREGSFAYEYFDTETSEWRGFFSRALQKGLSGEAADDNGMVTLGSLVDYLEKNVPLKAFQEKGVKQTPWKTTDGFRESELVLAISKMPGIKPLVHDSGLGETAYWQEVVKINTVSAYQGYLSQYPAGQFEKAARLKLGDLKWTNFKQKARKLLKYDDFTKSSGGLIRVSRDSKMGFINDENGDAIVPLIYEDVEDHTFFPEGLAEVCRGGKCGFINTKGQEVIPLRYHAALNFSEGLAWVRLGTGTSSDKCGYIDKSGREVISLNSCSRFPMGRNFSEGFAIIESNDKFGFIDKTGRPITPTQYFEANPFSEGLATVCLNNKWGFVDKTGQTKIPLKFDSAGSFSEGFASVFLNGKWGFIDKAGNSTIPPIYDFVQEFRGNFAEVTANNRKGVIDRSGKTVISSKFDRVFYDSDVELFFVSLNEKRGLLDKSGREVIPFKYDEINGFSEGYANVDLNGKRGYIDKKGNEIIPLKYEAFEDLCHCLDQFSEGIVLVKLNEKYGFIDAEDKKVIPIKYDDIWCDAFKKEGFIGVTLNGKKGFVDLYGNEYFDF